MDKKSFKDINVSMLGMGTMRLPTKKVKMKEVIDKEKAQEIIDYAYNNGVNYFDTAWMYHDFLSEDFVGEAMAKYPRDSYYLATKLPIWECKTPEDMEILFNKQLEKLKTDHFDFYLLHSLNKRWFKKCQKFGAYEFVKEKQAQGKIKYVGFSFHDSPKVLQEIVDTWEFDFAQLQINYLDWTQQDAKQQYEILEKASIPTIVMEPVRGGKLADLGEKGNNLLKVREPDMSIASWALRFVSSLDNVFVVLSGMSNMEQIVDNVNTYTNFKKIDDDDFNVLTNGAVNAYKNKDIVPCTACRYCMDCPKGVDIPLMFKLYNEYVLNKKDNKNRFIEKYKELSDNIKAHNCVSCGLCASHCPQNIDIPKKIHEINNFINKEI